ncbi:MULTISPECIES: response regulator transcription factor [Bacillaceae]|uniref:DNA-binding response regulator, OmpR family, contains REC and winged-helix (WHTH) domain n=2 Tax=Bacillaceae TaxID=186817 RepID=A0A1I4QYM2_9BACI|nr:MULTISPECIES: response regulator transcription factor [Bacillaceae]PBB04824.1 DNA-binding response regulator [Salimicrobium humidisoli]SFM45154.1 DNA-binding response regulator, OmpR family, contains REC and winged-helix (wHTH) domain [Salibacterium qingdaonense]
MTHILIVDDEQRMLDLIELYLLPYGYQTTKVRSGAKALEVVKTTPFDLVILDIMMKEMDGFETCQRLRTFSDVPVLMLTAKDQKKDVIKGLKTGADDYVTKPFDEDILLARVETLLRRNAPSAMEVNGLRWDESTYELSYQDYAIALTPKEFRLIGLLLKRPNHVYDRHDLLDLVWGFESDTWGRTVDSHVRNIREKIRRSGFPVDDHLKTVWGVGYKWMK